MQNTTQQDVIKFIDSQGWEYQEKGDQFMIKNGCPLCGNGKQNHFYINKQNGLWDCKVCGEKGNLFQLAQKISDAVSFQKFEKDKTSSGAYIKNNMTYDTAYIDECHKKLLENQPIFKYLVDTRKISLDTIKFFKLGWNGKRIIIPYQENGKIQNLQQRRNPLVENEKEPKYLNHSGSDISIFNADCLKTGKNDEPVFITEGGFDAMALWSQAEGKIQVVSGMGGAMAFPNVWKSYFKDKKKIYVVYDNDDKGKRGAQRVVESLGFNRCYVVNLPSGIKDVNEYFIKGNMLKDFENLLKTAQKLIPQGDEYIKPISYYGDKVNEALTLGNTKKGLETGFPNLDKILQGMRAGDLIVVSGATSTSKTFFTQNIALNLAKKDKSIMFFSLELMPEELYERFIMLETGINTDKFSGLNTLDNPEIDAIDFQRIDNCMSKINIMPVYFYDGKEKLGRDLLEKVATRAVKEYGAELIVVDHLHYFAVGTDDTAEIGATVRKAKEIARNLEVPVIMICHITKMERGRKVSTFNDLRGSSLIAQDADIVMMLNRNVQGDDKSEQEELFVNVDKNRHGRTGKIMMNFSTDNCRITEPNVSQ